MIATLGAATLTVMCFAQPSGSEALADTHRSHACSDPAFASGQLIVTGVPCRTGARIVTRASHRACSASSKHRRGRRCACHITRAQAEHFRGCYGRVSIGRWRCRGLFPGEGFDLTCRRGWRKVHGSAGG